MFYGVTTIFVQLRRYHHNCIGRASNRRKRLLIPPPPLFHFSYGQGGNRTPIPFRATVFETVAIPLCDPSKNVEEQTQPTGLCLWSTTQAGEHPLEYCCSSVRSLTSRFSSHAYQNKDFRSQRPFGTMESLVIPSKRQQMISMREEPNPLLIFSTKLTGLEPVTSSVTGEFTVGYE